MSESNWNQNRGEQDDPMISPKKNIDWHFSRKERYVYSVSGKKTKSIFLHNFIKKLHALLWFLASIVANVLENYK